MLLSRVPGLGTWGREARALGYPGDALQPPSTTPGLPSTPGPRRSGAPPTLGTCPGRAATARRPVARRGRSSGAESAEHCGRASTLRDRSRKGAGAEARGKPEPEAGASPSHEAHLSPSPGEGSVGQSQVSQGPRRSLAPTTLTRQPLPSAMSRLLPHPGSSAASQ